jgi:hypothetical protein
MGAQIAGATSALGGSSNPVGKFVDQNFLGGAERDAAAAQIQAGREANATQRYIFDQNRKDAQPWRQAGVNALGDLTSQMPDLNRSFTMADYQADPGYDFRMSEGQKAIERSAAARGGLNSGATMKSLTRFSQGTASDEYGKAYDRFNNDRTNRFNKLSALSGVGQVANQGIAAAGQNYGNNVSQNLMEMGNSSSAGIMGQKNAISNDINQGTRIGMLFSDAELKEHIAPGRNEVLQVLSSIRPYTFDYKSGAYGAGPQIGILAQELERTEFGRNIVGVDPAGSKYIKIPQAVGALLASVANLHERLSQIEGAR